LVNESRECHQLFASLIGQQPASCRARSSSELSFVLRIVKECSGKKVPAVSLVKYSINGRKEDSYYAVFDGRFYDINAACESKLSFSGTKFPSRQLSPSDYFLGTD